MTTYFTSDLHFGHANIIKYSNRPFASVREMDEALIANRNKRVHPTDTIYILGDVFFCDIDKGEEIVNRLNGNKLLIMGNHDKQLNKHRDRMSAHFKYLPALYETYIEGIHVSMCHYPMLVWNKSHHGAFMLHGHSHGSAQYPRDGRIMDVGVDCHAYAPVSWEAIKNKLSQVTTESIDHH